MKMLKLLGLAMLLSTPCLAGAPYHAFTDVPSAGRTSFQMSGQELIYASTAAASPSIILQGNGGRITASGGITASSATVKGNASVSGTLAVTGAVTASGGATVSGAPLAVSTNAVISGNATVGGTLGVTGASTLTGNTTVGGTLGVTGTSSFTGKATLSGGFASTSDSSVNYMSAENMSISNNLSVGGTLGVSKIVTLSSHTYITGSLGVGTTAPSEKIEVRGNIKADYGVIAATATVTGPVTLNGVAYTMPSSQGVSGQFLGQSATAGTLEWAAPSGAGDSVRAATETFTGAKTFTSSVTLPANGLIFVSTYTAFVPYYVIPPTTWVAASTQTWTVNLSTGVYELNIAGLPTAELRYLWDGDTSSNYAGSSIVTSYNSSTYGIEYYGLTSYGTIVPYAGSDKSQAHYTLTLGGSTTTVSMCGSVARRYGLYQHHGCQWHDGGYPKTLTIYTTGTFTGQISMRKVSD